MEQELKEYIQSLIPEGFPDGNDMVRKAEKWPKIFRGTNRVSLKRPDIRAIWNTERKISKMASRHTSFS